MFCPKCGGQIDANDKFCPSCGTPVGASPDSSEEETLYVNKPEKAAPAPKPQKVKHERPPRKPWSKGKKALAIILAILIVIIGLGITAIALIGNSAAKKAADYLEKGKYEQATKLYRREIADNKILNAIFEKMVEGKIDAKIKAQSDGKLEYSDAIDYFSAVFDMEDLLDDAAKEKIAKSIVDRCAVIQTAYVTEKKMDYDMAKSELSAWSGFELSYLKGFYEAAYSDLGCAKTTLEAITKFRESDSAFTRGEELFASGEYEEALAAYAKVSEDSDHYQEAQDKLLQTHELYRESVITSADEHIKAGDYPRAIAVLEYALTVLEEDSELAAKLQSCQTEYYAKIKTDALAESGELCAGDNYIEAMKTLQAAMNTVGEDSQLQAAYDKCVSDYVTNVVERVDAYMAENDFRNAVALLNSALADLPGNAALSAKLSEVEANTPVSILTQLKINYGSTNGYRIGNIRWNNGNPRDPFGNDYSTAINFAIVDGDIGDAYAYDEYRIYKKFSKITGTLAPYVDISQNGSMYIQILADGDLVYTSPLVTRKTDTFNFSVNIAGAEYIEIRVHIKSYNDASLILSDVLLWPQQ